MLLRSSVRQTFLSHMNYGNAPDLNDEDIINDSEDIPYFIANPHDTRYDWGSDRGRRPHTEMMNPYVISEQPLPSDYSDPEYPNDIFLNSSEDSFNYQFTSSRNGTLNRLPHVHLSELNVNNLTTDEVTILQNWFQEATEDLDYHTQLFQISHALRNTIPPTSFQKIGDIFEINRGTVSHHFNEIGWSTNPEGRNSLLSDSEMSKLGQFIYDRYENNNPASYHSVQHFVEEVLERIINIDTIRHIIRKFPDFKAIDGIPMEASRVFSDPQAIDAYYDRLTSILQDFPAALVINLDETGHQDWVDANPEKVIVPVSYEHDKFTIPIDRQSKRATLLVAITAAGDALRPLVIVPRQTCEQELYEIGFSPQYTLYAEQENGFVTAELFNYWADEVLFPYIEKTREEMKYTGEAVVILDGCTAHTNDCFQDNATYNGVELVFLPAHTSDQTQPLDLGVFGTQKAEASRIHPHQNLNSQSQKICKALCGYHKATTRPNIIGAFRRAGIISYWSDEHNCLLAKIQREEAKNVRHWTFNKSRISFTQHS
jgi:hypothetical protein